MKKIIFFIPFFLFLFSCSDDSEEQVEEQLSACFEINRNMLQIGEELQISNCSIGANSFEYSFGEGSFSTESSPTFSYQNPGEYTIKLTVTSEDGRNSIAEKKVNVNSIESNYIFTPSIDGDSFFPINLSFVNETFSYIENFQNVLSSNTSRYNYVEIDVADGSFSKKYLSERDYNSGNAFFNILSNNEKLVYTVRSLSDRIGLTQLKLDADWENPIVGNSLSNVLYGSLENNGDLIFYGAWRTPDTSDPNYSLYKRPSIEIRNDLGELIEHKLYLSIEQGFIGDIVSFGNGFVAFGGITDPTSFSAFENYRPMVIFLNNDFEYINHIEYLNTGIQATNFNDLNGTFHVEVLTNNNLVIYSHNEFRIIDSIGGEIIKETFTNQSDDVQGLIAIENGFILSTNDYLHKYDMNGNLLKSLKFNGRLTPNLILNEGQIYFASGYNTQFTNNIGTFSIIQTFFGAIDTDLNVININ